MKRLWKYISVELVIVLLLSVLSCAAIAENYRIEALKLNRWYQLSAHSPDMTVYRLKAKGEMIYTLSWKDYKPEYGSIVMGICKDKDCHNLVESFNPQQTSGSSSLVLYSGTYYLLMFDNQGLTKVRVTAKPASKINKPNYALNRAINLKKDKVAEVAQTMRTNYPRWYKIKLSQNQTVTISATSNRFGFDLCDSNLNVIQLNHQSDPDGDKYMSAGVLASGTYYLVSRMCYLPDVVEHGLYCSFNWN